MNHITEEDIQRAIRAARGADPSGGMYYREAEPIVRAVIDALQDNGGELEA